MTSSKKIYISSLLMAAFFLPSALPVPPLVERLLGALGRSQEQLADPLTAIRLGGDAGEPAAGDGGEREEGMSASLKAVWDNHSGKILFVSGVISGAIIVTFFLRGKSPVSVAVPADKMGAVEHIEAALRLMRASGSGKASSEVAGLLGL